MLARSGSVTSVFVIFSLVAAFGVAAPARANWWSFGRASGSTFGGATDLMGKPLPSSFTPAELTFGANSASGLRTGSGSTSGGIGGAGGTGSFMARLSFDADITGSLDPAPTGSTMLRIGLSGIAFGQGTNISGTIGASLLISELAFEVTGNQPVEFQIAATNRVASTLLGPLVPTPVAGTGAMVVGSTLMPGVYGLPSINANVSSSGSPGYFGDLTVTLFTVPAPSVGGLGLIGAVAMLRSRRRTA